MGPIDGHDIKEMSKVLKKATAGGRSSDYSCNN